MPMDSSPALALLVRQRILSSGYDGSSFRVISIGVAGDSASSKESVTLILKVRRYGTVRSSPTDQTRCMSVMREELHHLVDRLPEEKVAPLLRLEHSG